MLQPIKMRGPGILREADATTAKSGLTDKSLKKIQCYLWTYNMEMLAGSNNESARKNGTVRNDGISLRIRVQHREQSSFCHATSAWQAAQDISSCHKIHHARDKGGGRRGAATGSAASYLRLAPSERVGRVSTAVTSLYSGF